MAFASSTLRIHSKLETDEVLYVEYLKSNIKRLTCLETHCCYYLGMEGSAKPKAFMFFPRELLTVIEEYKGRIQANIVYTRL